MFVKGYKKQFPPAKFLWTVVVEHKRGIPNRYLNGVSVIRHAVPLQEHGTFNQTTVFLTIVAGKGGGNHGSTNDGISDDYINLRQLPYLIIKI